MNEVHLAKNKVDLADYDLEEDIHRRQLLADLDQTSFEVLEEILFSPVKFPLTRLMSNLSLEKNEITPILERLMDTHLLSVEEDDIVVNKEVRKTYENEIDKFEEVPGIESFRAMLKRVPIHVLPNWYSIPRSSDNIFDSIVDRVLLTPQKFQRYLLELNFPDPVIGQIVQDVHQSENYLVSSYVLMDKYDLSQERFEEIMIYLEFSCVCCLTYEREGDHWQEKVSFFKEWRDYLLYLKKSQNAAVCDISSIRLTRPSDFAFVEDMSTLLNISTTDPIVLPMGAAEMSHIAQRLGGFNLAAQDGISRFHTYVGRLINKLTQLQLAMVQNDRLMPTKDGAEWLGMAIDKRALELYRHPLNSMQADEFDESLLSSLRAAEKCIAPVVKSGWVDLQNFLEGVAVPLGSDSTVTLGKKGRHWHYTLPSYSDEEKQFLIKVVTEWLFEMGITATATIDDRPCFRVTPFGRSFYD